MSRFIRLLICLGWLLSAAACATNRPAPTPTQPSIAAAVVTQSPSLPNPTLTMAIETPIPTNTATATLTPSSTNTSSLPTMTPTAANEPLPEVNGRIYFFWDPKLIGDVNISPVYKLYMATSRKSPDDWNIQPLVEEIIGHPQIALSPGKTKFAFTILEDKNSDGSVSDEGYDRGFDAPNIFTYTLVDDSFSRLTSEYFSGYLGWLSNDELAVGFRAINTENLSWRQVVSEEALPDDIQEVVLSPDGRTIAVSRESGPINLIETESGKIMSIDDEISIPNIEMVWSADGQWLVLNRTSTGQLILVNNQTMETMFVNLSEPIRYLVWSLDNRYIAAVQEVPEGTALFLLDISTLSYQVMLSTPGQIYNLLWSPDSSQLAMALTEVEGEVSLKVLDVQSGNFKELWHSVESVRFYMPTWSPDSEWLLFFNGQSWSLPDDHAGIYVIHKDGEHPYLILETSNTRDPKAFYWLPEVESQ